MKKLRVAIQMDPLEKLNKAADSTLYVALAAARRGYELFHYEPRHLHMTVARNGVRVTAAGHALKFKNKGQDSAYLDKPQTLNLADFDVIFMRQDPPFDLSYIAATHILEHLRDKVQVVNDPAGVRNAPEKLLITHFPEFMAPTLITRDRKAIERFRVTHDDLIFKNLFGWAGHGIFHLRPGDDYLPALMETLEDLNSEPWMIQKYIPAIRSEGDKRIVLLDGEPVGVFTRVPDRKDGRGNMRVGAKARSARLTRRDREICEELGPILRARGLLLAGIDVIGEYLTDINVTSPTGLVVADRLAKRRGRESIAEKFWDLVAK